LLPIFCEGKGGAPITVTPRRALRQQIDLIAVTTIRSGPEAYAQLYERVSPGKLKVSGAQLAAVNVRGHNFGHEWNW
jgi:hypothetical protein